MVAREGGCPGRKERDGVHEQLVHNMGHDDPTIRRRAVDNICSKWKWGTLDPGKLEGSRSVMDSMLRFLTLEAGKGSSSPYTRKVLEMLADFTHHPVSIRLLIRANAVAILEGLRGKACATDQPYIDACLHNLVTQRSDTVTVYEEEMASLRESRAAVEAAKLDVARGEMEKRLRQTLLRQRPQSVVFAELASRVGHTNPRLAAEGTRTLARLLSMHIAPSDFLDLGGAAVIVEACDALPLVLRRGGHPDDVQLSKDLLDALALVMKGDLAVLIFHSLSSALADAQGPLRARTAELLWDCAPHAAAAATPDQAYSLAAAAGHAVLSSLQKGAPDSNVCAPGVLLELRAFTAWLQELWVNSKLSHLTPTNTSPAPHHLHLLRLLLGKDVPPDIQPAPHRSSLASRHPKLLLLIEYFEGVIGEGDPDDTLDVGTTDLEVVPSPVLTRDASTLFEAFYHSVDAETSWDALAAVDATRRCSPTALKTAIPLTTFFLPAFTRFLVVPPGNQDDAHAVSVACLTLSRLLAEGMVPQDLLVALSEVAATKLIPLLDSDEVEYATHYPLAARDALHFVRCLVQALSTEQDYESATTLVLETGLLHKVWRRFLAPLEHVGLRSEPKDATEWCLMDHINGQVVELAGAACELAAVVIGEVAVHIGGEVEEAVQSVLCSAMAILDHNAASVEGPTPVLLGKIGGLATVASLAMSQSPLFGTHSTTQGVLVPSLIGSPDRHPRHYYAALSAALAKSRAIPERISDAVAYMLSAPPREAAAECARFFSSLVIRLYNDSEGGDDVMAARCVLEETLFPYLFAALPSHMTDLRAFSCVVGLLLEAVRVVGGGIVHDPSTWGELLCAKAAGVADLLHLAGREVLVSVLEEHGAALFDYLVDGLREGGSSCVAVLCNIFASKEAVLLLPPGVVPTVLGACEEVVADSRRPPSQRMLPCPLLVNVVSSGVPADVPPSLLAGVEGLEHKKGVLEAVASLVARLPEYPINPTWVDIFRTASLEAVEARAASSRSEDAERCVLAYGAILRNAFHNRTDYPTESHGGLFEAMAALLQSYTPGMSKRLGHRILTLTLSLAKNIMLASRADPAVKKLHRQVLAAVLEHLHPTVSKGNGTVFTGPVGGAARQALQCLACAGVRPHLWVGVPVQRCNELVAFFESTLWCVARRVEHASEWGEAVLASLINLALSERGQELIPSIHGVWDALLGGDGCEAGGVLSLLPAPTLLLLRNLAFRQQNQATLARDTRVTAGILQVLRGVCGGEQLAQKWAASSLLWVIVYRNEKAKSLLRQAALTPAAIEHILTQLRHQREVIESAAGREARSRLINMEPAAESASHRQEIVILQKTQDNLEAALKLIAG